MRLIDADALVEDIKSEIDDDKEIYPDDKTSIIFRAGMKIVIRIVKNQDTVDPVKHGRWIFKGNGNADCSCCDYRSSRVYDDDNADRYCRHCGAKMDEDTGGDYLDGEKPAKG